MAAISRADASWEGDLTHGGGKVRPASGAFPELTVTWAGRAERPEGATSPEELIAAAHAACYSMALSNGMGKAGLAEIAIDTRAEVEFVPGTGITTITLTVRGRATGLEADQFAALAAAAKEGCPVSKALKGNVEIRLDAAIA